MSIAGLPFIINQLNGCLFGLTPASAAFAAGGGSGSITVVVLNPTCGWTAAPDPNSFWLTINGPSTGIGSGTASFTVALNLSRFGRTGTIAVAGQTFTVVQAGTTCSFALAQASQAFTAAAANGTASVQAPAGCFWTAQSTAPFVAITGGASGSGNGTVSYSVLANSASTPRNGGLDHRQSDIRRHASGNLALELHRQRA